MPFSQPASSQSVRLGIPKQWQESCCFWTDRKPGFGWRRLHEYPGNHCSVFPRESERSPPGEYIDTYPDEHVCAPDTNPDKYAGTSDSHPDKHVSATDSNLDKYVDTSNSHPDEYVCTTDSDIDKYLSASDSDRHEYVDLSASHRDEHINPTNTDPNEHTPSTHDDPDEQSTNAYSHLAASVTA